MIVVTGASGQLGRLVIQNLLEQVPASQIVAAVRTPEKVQDLAAQGVQIRQADYERPESLDKAFQGSEKVLLISSSDPWPFCCRNRIPGLPRAVSSMMGTPLAASSVVPPRRWQPWWRPP